MSGLFYPHFIDFEASGFGEDSYPIEVAWNGAGGTVESHLIKPDTIKSWTYWDKDAEVDAHRISRDILSQLGTSPKTIALRMNDSLAGQVLYSDAPQFDGFWLARLYEEVDLNPTFKLGSVIDLFDLKIDESQKIQGNSTEHVQKRFDNIIDTLGLQAWENIALRPHRAGNDVRHLMETYRLLNECGGITPKN